MNDMQAVKALCTALRVHLPWQAQRLTFLARFILALVQVRSVNLAQLAPVLSPRAKSASNYIRLQRFFRGFSIDQAQIARAVVGLLPLGERWVLSLDRTHWRLGRSENNLLVLGVVYRGIALPLFWTSLGKAGNSNTEERIAVMARFVDTFGSGRIAYLLADREFVGERWFRYLHEEGIGFRIRVKDNPTLVSREGIEQPILTAFRDLRVGQRRALRAPRRLFGVSVYLAAERLDDEQWLLVASSDTPHRAIPEFADRWSIETLFAALKTRGFRFEDTHLTKPERIERLLALLTLATTWAVLVGQWAHRHRPIPQKKTLDRPQYSLFRYGLDVLARVLNHIGEFAHDFLQILGFLLDGQPLNHKPPSRFVL